MRKLFLHEYLEGLVLEMIFIEYFKPFRFMFRIVFVTNDEILGVRRIGIPAALAGMGGFIIPGTMNFLVTLNNRTIFTINMLTFIVVVANFSTTTTTRATIAARITEFLKVMMGTDIEVHIDFAN